MSLKGIDSGELGPRLRSIMQPLALTLSLSFLACSIHARELDGGRIEAYELVVPATFALSLSRAEALDGQGSKLASGELCLTSSNMVKLLDLPEDARCYWVFDFESRSSMIAGALVMASKHTGEIYEEFAYGYGVTLFDLIDGGESGNASVGVINLEQDRISIIVNMAMTWNIAGSLAPVATFGRFALQIDETAGHTTVSFSSVSDLAGDGLEQNSLMVTKGRLEASGQVRAITP